MARNRFLKQQILKSKSTKYCDHQISKKFTLYIWKKKLTKRYKTAVQHRQLYTVRYRHEAGGACRLEVFLLRFLLEIISRRWPRPMLPLTRRDRRPSLTSPRRHFDLIKKLNTRRITYTQQDTSVLKAHFSIYDTIAHALYVYMWLIFTHKNFINRFYIKTYV